MECPITGQGINEAYIPKYCSHTGTVCRDCDLHLKPGIEIVDTTRRSRFIAIPSKTDIKMEITIQAEADRDAFVGAVNRLKNILLNSGFKLE